MADTAPCSVQDQLTPAAAKVTILSPSAAPGPRGISYLPRPIISRLLLPLLPRPHQTQTQSSYPALTQTPLLRDEV